MILVIDNYDSFTFNLFQFMGELGAEPVACRNDAMTVDSIGDLKPRGIVISPGPGRPEDAGISVQLVQRWAPELPILGVCLGHQAVAVSQGASVGRAPAPVHGKTVRVTHDDSTLFEGVRNPFEAGRYHSLIVERDTLPDHLQVTASTADGLVMAIRHRSYPLFGVQFHPESILTDDGRVLLRNFLRTCEEIR